MNSRSAETDEAVERVAAAAERASESFMERWRRRPIGDGDRMYEYADLLSTFASELRYPPEQETP